MAASATSKGACTAAATRSAPASPRRLVVRAAAQGTGAATGAATRRRAKQRQLVSALLEAARREVIDGWMADLVLPLVGDDTGAAAPPLATQPPQALASADGRFVEVEGVALHYKEAWPSVPGDQSAAAAASSSLRDISGSSSGGTSTSTPQQPPAILLVHGFNGSTFSWRNTMQELADATGCRVIAYDRPPFGLAERPLQWGGPRQRLQFDPYSLEGSARLAGGLLDALGVPAVVAVGHSAGALVCMELAQRQPGRVAGLAFVAPALPTTPDNSFARRATLGQQLRFLAVRGLLQDDRLGLRYVRRQLLKRRDEVAAGKAGLSSADEEETPQDVIDGYLLPLQAHDWDRGALLNLRAFSIPPSYKYSALQAPVLLVAGSEDGALTKSARVLAGLLQERPSAATKFVELQGVGHIPMEERPGEFNALLSDFVRQAVLEQQGR